MHPCVCPPSPPPHQVSQNPRIPETNRHQHRRSRPPMCVGGLPPARLPFPTSRGPMAEGTAQRRTGGVSGCRDLVREQLHGAAPPHDLAEVQRQRRERGRRADLGGGPRVAGGEEGHVVVLRGADHDGVDGGPGHVHVPRVEGPGGRDALGLGDDDAAGRARGHRLHACVAVEGLPLHREVPVRVGGGAADEGTVDGEGLEGQVRVAVQLQTEDRGGGRGREGSTAAPAEIGSSALRLHWAGSAQPTTDST